jgi:hypothetical protein
MESVMRNGSCSFLNIARLISSVALSALHLLPGEIFLFSVPGRFTNFLQYLLPGLIVLAIFVSAMIGRGIIYIDDKARGLHEGYLASPISKFESTLGFNLSDAIKSFLAGFVITTLGVIIEGFQAERFVPCTGSPRG